MRLEQIQTVAGDLITHLTSNVRRQVKDIGTTAEHAGLEDEIIMRIIITGLSYELIEAARFIEMNEKDFLSLIGTMYRAVEEAKGKV